MQFILIALPVYLGMQENEGYYHETRVTLHEYSENKIHGLITS